MTFTDAILNSRVEKVTYTDGFYNYLDLSRGTDPTIKPEQPDTKPVDPTVIENQRVPVTSIATFVQTNDQTQLVLIAMMIMVLMIVILTIAISRKQ